jgi:hypothetical protein
MPDPDYDPDELNKTKWFLITIPFAWIVKVWKIIFGKEKENEKI